MRTNNQKKNLLPSKGRVETSLVTTPIIDVKIPSHFETFQTYFKGHRPQIIDGALIYKAQSLKDAKVKLSKALTYITSLGLPLIAVHGPNNTFIVKQFTLVFNRKI